MRIAIGPLRGLENAKVAKLAEIAKTAKITKEATAVSSIHACDFL